MRIQRLLENDEEPTLFFSVSIIAILIFLSFFFSFFSKSLKTEDRILAGGVATFFTESFIIYFSFTKYPEYFRKIFCRYKLFFLGLKYYLMLIPVIMLGGIVSYTFFEKLHLKFEFQKIISFYIHTKSIKLIIFLFFLSCFIAPFTEEFIFRGLLYKALKRESSFIVAVILNSLIFALFHNELFNFIGIFMLGVALSIIFEKHKSI